LLQPSKEWKLLAADYVREKKSTSQRNGILRVFHNEIHWPESRGQRETEKIIMKSFSGEHAPTTVDRWGGSQKGKRVPILETS